ncbi:SsrA-binding protein SmpB [Kytococcus sp. HMSC28H12]|uniref:SsrA-binding protein SmpB n=1 Tax=Kytococcus sp. HMSC28H12 TaxID=1581067 RepID=UPI0008A212F4|nr:SsrA-binding protein SmpB [Kytococcus sp. HMSC28H12]OFS13358.1 SsrA-binding protein [Kytococcus sp. HMSC28H12]
MAAKKKVKDDPRNKVIATNRKARHDYVIEDTYEAGLALLGTEVKSLRMGRASLVEGFVNELRGELWLENVHVPEYLNGSWTNHAARRRRKLLLHRHEMDKLISRSSEAGHTIVPLQLYFKDGRVKVEIALAKGKKQYDKRHALREKQDEREKQAQMSLRYRMQRGR